MQLVENQVAFFCLTLHQRHPSTNQMKTANIIISKITRERLSKESSMSTKILHLLHICKLIPKNSTWTLSR